VQLFAENTYTLRYTGSLVASVVATAGPDAATLAAIESALNAAHQLYWQGRYQDAIDSYKRAGTLIYQYLDASTPIAVTGIYDQLSKDVALFDPLLNVAAQHLNLLPAVTTQPLKPTIPVDPAKLGSTTFDKLGIREAALVHTAATTTTTATSATTGITASATTEAARVNLTQPGAALAAGTHLPPAATTAATSAGAAAAATTATVAATRSLGVMVGTNVVALQWAAGSVPAIDTIKKNVYSARTALTSLPDVLLRPQQPADAALALPHEYYYVVPLGIAQALQALGDYANAETSYLQAAGYQFINTAIEVPYVWLALANLYLKWGDALFQDGDAASAAAVYTKVVTLEDTAPGGALYTLANFAPVAASAKTALAALVAHTAVPSTINPLLAAVLADVRAQLAKIKGGLDFFGLPANTVPIWTFDYLQSVAVNFTNLALNAEQNFISFQARSDDATVTKVQLQQTVVQAQGDAQAASMQADAAQAELQAYQDGVALAQLRAADATASANDYASQSWHQNVMQAEASQVQGGDDGDPGQLVNYLNQLRAGKTISDSRGTVGAALSLDASEYARQYQIDQLQRTAAEMQSARTQAQDEANAAQARVDAANSEVAAAQLRATGAQQVLDAFDSSFFTPDVWHAMAQTMYGLYQRYFTMALRVAKLMQAAYNFETDQSLHLIRSSYASGEVQGLLGADLLMADVQGFTYDLVTSTAGKQQPIRHEISLATSYSYSFETQLRKTGAMDFETRVDDFDAAYPGTYAGRIASVEVAVDGIVPVLGLAGTLTNNGVSTYRVPGAAWPPGGTPGVKYRIQPKETLVLSDFQLRDDDLLFRGNANARRVFEGAGVASSWHLEIPKAVNDIDFGALTDVRLIFYYDARYDPTLKSRVLSHLAALPGVTQRSRSLPLAWLYPDAFFHFQDTGTLTVTLQNSDFPRNQLTPVLTDVALLVTTVGKPASGIALSLATPAHAAGASGTTGADGSIASGGASPFTALANGSAVGTYTIAMTSAANPGFVSGGKLDLSAIVNVSLLFGYGFTPRA
jgi:hypothetical protein